MACVDASRYLEDSVNTAATDSSSTVAPPSSHHLTLPPRRGWSVSSALLPPDWLCWATASSSACSATGSRSAKSKSALPSKPNSSWWPIKPSRSSNAVAGCSKPASVDLLKNTCPASASKASTVQRDMRLPNADRSFSNLLVVLTSSTTRTLAPGKSLTNLANNSSCEVCTERASCNTKIRAGKLGPCVETASSSDMGANTSLKRFISASELLGKYTSTCTPSWRRSCCTKILP